MIYVVDTHPIIWALENDPRLSATALAVLKDPTASPPPWSTATVASSRSR
jgi:PIN domain nuclease of toxin-antitoxin system